MFKVLVRATCDWCGKINEVPEGDYAGIIKVTAAVGPLFASDEHDLCEDCEADLRDAVKATFDRVKQSHMKAV